jgi:hypothetical protein
LLPIFSLIPLMSSWLILTQPGTCAVVEDVLECVIGDTSTEIEAGLCDCICLEVVIDDAYDMLAV